MTAQQGALVLIKAGNGGSPESFTTIGGLRASQMDINHQPMVATNVESGAWRQLLANAGILSFRIGGSGRFTDSAAEETLRAHAFSGSINNYRFVFPNGNNVTGPFAVTSYSRSGEEEGEELFALTLESAGTISFSVS